MDDAVAAYLPDGSWPPVPLNGVVELRLHGVGGTPPSEMLDDPAPYQVSGDRMAGVWRGRTSGPAAVEAYSWGGLTERALGAALWLVVLPFALVNVAGWMPARRGSGSHGVHRGVVRLAGLALTAVYAVFAAVIGMDFLSYQCAVRTGCAASGWWLIGAGGIAHDVAGQRVVLGAALPVLVVLGLALLTNVSRRRYEQWRLAPPSGHSPDEPTEAGLGSTDFWTGQGYAAHLADLHIFVGLGVVALLLDTTAAATTTSPWAPALVDVTLAALASAAAAATVTRLRRHIPLHVAPALGALLVAVAAVVAWSAAPGPALPDGPLPGILPTFGAVIGVFLASAVLVVALGLADQQGRPDLRTRLRHAYTPFSLLVLGGLLATSVLAGAALWVAGTVGERYAVGDPARADHQAAILYPQPFEALARSLGLIVVLAVVAAGVAAAGVAWRDRGSVDARWAGLQDRYAADHIDVGGHVATDSPTGWKRRVRRALGAPARMLTAVEWGTWTLAGAGWLAAVAYAVFWFAHGSDPGAARRRYDDLAHLWGLLPLSLSITLLTLLPVGAVWVMRQSLKGGALSRHVGIAWDLATFWPRSFHPLCPPCYAERAVPETQARMLRIWAAGGAVDLLGHSQGAVIATAAVASLRPEWMPPQPARLALVTYGNPLVRLCARYFPRYVDAELLARIAERVPGAWTNVYRDTDPIGARVDGPAAEVWLADPATNRSVVGDPPPPVRGHAERGYRRQTPFAARVAAVTAALRPVRPQTPVTQAPVTQMPVTQMPSNPLPGTQTPRPQPLRGPLRAGR